MISLHLLPPVSSEPRDSNFTLSKGQRSEVPTRHSSEITRSGDAQFEGTIGLPIAASACEGTKPQSSVLGGLLGRRRPHRSVEFA
jgi:hypothetical protein